MHKPLFEADFLKGFQMTFELTDSLIDDILFSMENQDAKWQVRAPDGALVNAEDISGKSKAQSEEYYDIPEWTSADGYNLMETFTNSIRMPRAREDLRRILQAGRGVFRNFKTTVKLYPQIERKWYLFKNESMKKRVVEWYNTLRDSWGLEQLEYNPREETEDLVQTDFVFSEYNPQKDGGDIRTIASFLAKDYEAQFDPLLAQAVTDIWQNLSHFSAAEAKLGFVCRSQTDEFIGCLLVSFCPSSAKKAVMLTDFFVLPNFRGMGIAEALLQKCKPYLEQRGIQWILLANATIPDFMQPLLQRFGFEQQGAGGLVATI